MTVIECPNCHMAIDPLATSGCPYCRITLSQIAEWMGLGSVESLVYELTNGYPEDYYIDP